MARAALQSLRQVSDSLAMFARDLKAPNHAKLGIGSIECWTRQRFKISVGTISATRLRAALWWLGCHSGPSNCS